MKVKMRRNAPIAQDALDDDPAMLMKPTRPSEMIIPAMPER